MRISRLVPVVMSTLLLFSACGKSSSDSKTKVNKSAADAAVINDACKVLTLDAAKTFLGPNAEKSDLPVGDTSSDDIVVSQCHYRVPATDAASITTSPTASVLVRSAKTSAGKVSNTAVFSGAQRPSQAQDVSGYGDAAFWNPEFGQLNILAGGNWYIVSAGPTKVSERTLNDAKKLSDAMDMGS